MFWIDTRSVPAKVIEIHPRGDRAFDKFKCHTMRPQNGAFLST